MTGSGQKYGGLDGKLQQTIAENVGGMAHLGKLMSNEGSMTKVYNSKLTPDGRMKPMTKAGKR